MSTPVDLPVAADPDELTRVRSELDDARGQVDNLTFALSTARRIGAAIGIVMAMMKVDYDDAYELLSRMSQHKNRKLRDVADDVIYTGLISEPGHRRRATDVA